MKAYSENGDRFDFTITDADGRDVADQFIPNLIDDATAIDDEFRYFVPEFKENTANRCESLCEEEQKVLDAGKRQGHQAVKELPHTDAAQCHAAADGSTFTQFEVSNGLLRFFDHGTLTADGGEL